MGRLRVADRLRVVSLVAVVFVTAFDGLALSTLVPQIAVDLHLGGLYGAFTAVYALALVTLTGGPRGPVPPPGFEPGTMCLSGTDEV